MREISTWFKAEILNLLKRVFNGELAVGIALNAESEAAESVVVCLGKRLTRPDCKGKRRRGANPKEATAVKAGKQIGSCAFHPIEEE